MSIATTLEALRDIEGVYGSFVSDNGKVRGRDLPKFFDDEIIKDSAPRLARIWETFATLDSSAEPGHVILKYSGHRLYLRAVRDCVLCVVANAEINMPALRMAVNLVGRRLGPLLEQEPQHTPSIPPPLPAQRAPAQTASLPPPAATSPAAASTVPTAAVATNAVATAASTAASASSTAAPAPKRQMVFRGRKYDV